MKKIEKKSGKRNDVPKGVVIILLLAIIVISVINTYAILNFINNAKTPVPTGGTTTVGSEQAGVIKLEIIEAPEEGQNG